MLDSFFFSEKTEILSEKNSTGFILLKNPFLIEFSYAETAVLIHSEEDFVIYEAEKIIQGLSFAKGKKNW